ncbi:MAG: c-type cytochrome [Lysobacteraceae bacterium]|nr:c-type cytochrome [Xanthomonadaceae bacterium]MCZ8319347.1 c-type cytochrome [Silanimonas sp.]
MRNHDLVFLKHFSQVIAVLFGIMVLLILLGLYLNSRKVHEPNPIAEARVVERIQPLGGVYAGETGAAAAAAAVKAAAEAAAAAGPPYGGTLDGAVIYQNLCSACHANGAGGAPAPTAAAWAPRLAQGRDTLVKHATEGFQGAAGIMPARGGNARLTDEQVAASVDYMIKKYQ